MLSMIHDRIKNAEKYHKEHFSKLIYVRKNRTLFEVYSKDGPDNYHERARRRMKRCNHKEDLEIIMALYKVRYYEGDEGFKMYEPERLPKAETIEAEAEAKLKAVYEAHRVETTKELEARRTEEAETEVKAV